jgi:dTDP-4-amino-4,6-dideoxygalactose transaminase
LKHAALKAFSTRPVFHAMVLACRVARRDYDHFINGSVRGFRQGHLLALIRRQPSVPLLAVLERRLRTYKTKRLARRTSKGELLARMLKDHVVCPGGEMSPHTHWVFPILVDDPERVIALLRESGFDATQGESLCVVAPPGNRPELDPSTARNTLPRIVFLPFYPEMPARAVRRMARILLRDDVHLICPPIDQEPPVGFAGRG